MSSITLKDARTRFKAIGYQLKTTRYSEFIGTKIIHKETGKILTSMLNREDYDFHQPATALREELKGRVFDGSWRVVL